MTIQEKLFNNQIELNRSLESKTIEVLVENKLENQNKLDIAKERALKKMLNLYVQDKNKRSREKQALNYIFSNEDNLDDDELEKNAKIIENGNQNIIDPRKFGTYYDLQFPVLTF